ncbi:MAG: hypothetical protein ABH983_04730, partial [Candidatus Micrarchaeota archaeon]
EKVAEILEKHSTSAPMPEQTERTKSFPQLLVEKSKDAEDAVAKLIGQIDNKMLEPINELIKIVQNRYR